MQRSLATGHLSVSSGCGSKSRLRACALLATTALVAAAALMPATALAQDATWLLNPGSGDFNTDANWNPAQVPSGTAFFGQSNTTNLSISGRHQHRRLDLQSRCRGL